MLSFVLRRAILRPGIFSFSTVPKLPTCAILSNRYLLSNWYPALAMQRNLATIAKDQNSGAAANSEPEPEPESKRKSTRRKAGSSTKVAGKVTGKKTERAKETKMKPKPKITIKPGDLPPKSPGSIYTLWFAEWYRSQPKIEGPQAAQNRIREAAKVWHTISESDKQRYREKLYDLRAEYHRRLEEWRKQVDPGVLRELNLRRVASGRRRIRGPSSGRPIPGFFRYFLYVRQHEYPRTEEDYKTYFRAVAQRASSQWKAMSDAERAKYTDEAKADFAAWREKRAESQARQ
ncbi:hypothetical protein BJV74DRAFT_835494 [Russula compacta]|nr:hypothetical protein BJV74DRAFT_835494 [Russula compacta]